MKKLLIAGLLAVGLHAKGAATIDEQKLADAIYRAEGGAKARVPYGILAVPVHSAAEARRVCIRTIHNRIVAWLAAGARGDVFAWLAATYCPASADPTGNRNWTRNVRWIYQH